MEHGGFRAVKLCLTPSWWTQGVPRLSKPMGGTFWTLGGDDEPAEAHPCDKGPTCWVWGTGGLLCMGVQGRGGGPRAFPYPSANLTLL